MRRGVGRDLNDNLRAAGGRPDASAVDNPAALAAMHRLIEARSGAAAPARDANRWLSPGLVAASATTGPRGFDRQGCSTRIDRAGRTRRPPRRRWQLLAAGVLLLASGAFSYLAWSGAERREPPASPPVATPPKTEADAVDSRNAALLARVQALREDNHRLRLQLEELLERHRAVPSP
jgi:hypothetical protein